MLKHFIRSDYFSYFTVFIVLGSFLVLYLPKGAFFLMINAHHTPWSDFIFKYTTYLGDGLIYVLMVVALLLYRYYFAILAALIGIIQGISLYLLKHVLFAGWPRPSAFFAGEVEVHTIPGVSVHSANSFPSGHTATAFALFAILSLVAGAGARHRPGDVLFFVLACAAGYSRIHLSQHFLVDVYVGAVAGVACVIAGLALTDKLFASKKALLMRRSLLHRDRA